MYRHAKGFENNYCHIQVLKTAASFYGHAKLFQCQRWFAMILNEQYYFRKLTCQWHILFSQTWQVQRRSRGLGWSGLRALVEKPKLEVLGPLWAAGLPHPRCTKVIVLIISSYNISLKLVLRDAPQFQWEAKQRLSLGVCSEFLDASKIEACLAGRVREQKLKTRTTPLPYLVPCQKNMWYSLINFQAVISLSQIQ